MTALYPNFAATMALRFPNYQWEGLEVVTGDDYILTLFHVWQEGMMDSDLGPVMFQHGAGNSASSYLQNVIDTQVEAFVEEGHHVYLGNNRGFEYSRGHATIDPIANPEQYWDFSWADMAYDVQANVKAMYNNSGKNNGVYIGNSQGTVQMIVALVEDEDLLKSMLSKVILTAPCIVPGPFGELDLSEESFNNIGGYQSQGVYSLPSNDWETDLDKICKNLPKELCEKAKNKTQDQENWASVKTQDHWYQVKATQRFQRYKKTWSYPDSYEQEMYDLSQITRMPIGLIIGEADTTCELEWAEWLAASLSTLDYKVLIPGGGHGAPNALLRDNTNLLNNLIDYIQSPNVWGSMKEIECNQTTCYPK